jgi:hypothetical protein
LPDATTTLVGRDTTDTLTNKTIAFGSNTFSGSLAIANGGTGQATANAAFNALAPSQTGNSGKYLTTDGTDTSWASNPLGTVTSVAASVPSFLSIAGSPITTSGTLAISLSGTALPTTSGGTGLTSFTANGVAYASSSSTLATGSSLIFDGTKLQTNVGQSNAANNVITGASLLIESEFAFRQRGATAGISGETYAAQIFGGSGLGPLELYSVSSYPVVFGVSATEGMRLTNTGLGIKTNSVGLPLSIGASGTGFFGSSSVLNTYVNSNLGTTLDASGNLGIGGITPTSALDVLGSFFNGGQSRTNGGTKTFGFRIPHFLTATSPMNVIGGLSTTSVNLVYIGGSDGNIGGTAATDLYFYTAANNTTANGTLRYAIDSTGTSIWSVGGSESMRLNSTGLGIGTNNPTQELEIKAPSIPTLKFNQAGTYGAEIALRGNDLDIAGSANAIVFYTGGNNDVSTTERVRITPSGNFDIGSTFSGQPVNGKLTIYQAGLSLGATNSIVIGNNDTGGAGSQAIWLGAFGNGAYGAKVKVNYNYAATVSTSLSFETSNGGTLTEAVRIDASQNVGIGTNNPIAKLDVENTSAKPFGTAAQLNAVFKGSVSIGEGGSIGFDYFGSHTNAPTSMGYAIESQSGSTKGSLVFGTRAVTTDTAPTERMRISSDGNVVIGLLNENVASVNQRLLITGSPEGATLHGIFIHNNSFSSASARIALSPRYSFLYNTSPFIQAVSESTSAAALTFGTTTGGTASERMRIDSVGRVTMPYQSGFAYGSSEVTVVGSNYILFSGGSYNYNVGSILNLTGGTSGASRVTVPVSGYYSVNVSIMGSTDGTRIEMFITKNGTNIFGTNSISSQYNNAQINGVFYFAANDYLEIYKQAGSIYGSNSPNNFFTVRLLG